MIETMPTQISQQNSPIKINEFISEVNPPRNISNDVTNSKINEIGNKVVIIGDSLLNGIVDDKLSNNNRIMTVIHPGCTTNDLKFDVINPLRVSLASLCHIATNDITNNVDTISNYQVVMEK